MDPINEHYLMVSFSCGLEGLSLKTNFSNEGIVKNNMIEIQLGVYIVTIYCTFLTCTKIHLAG